MGALMIWRIRDTVSSGMDLPRWRLLILCLVVLFLGFSNPGRAALMLVFPLYIFDRTLSFNLHRSASSRPSGWFRLAGVTDAVVLVGLGASFILATSFHYGLLHFGVVETMHNASRLQWEGIQGVLAHSRIFINGWLPYLGSEGDLYSPNALVENLLQPVRLLFAIWLSWVGIAELLEIRRNADPLRGALAAAWLGAFLPILFMYLAFSPLAIDQSTTRYFIVPIVILLAMGAFRVSGYVGWRRRVAPLAAIVASGFLVAICAIRFVPGLSQPLPSIAVAPTSVFMELADQLVREKLKWGYATWWYAEVSTVLSSGVARVSPIYFEGDEIRPVPYMRQRQWYRPETWKGETFLALRRDELSAERITSLSREFGPPTRQIANSTFEILVFDRNIASNFECDKITASDFLRPAGLAAGRVVSVNLPADIEKAETPSVTVVVLNDGQTPLAGIGKFPVSVQVQLTTDDGKSINPEWLDWPLPCAIHPGNQRSFAVSLPALPDGSWSAQFEVGQLNNDGKSIWSSKSVLIGSRQSGTVKILSTGFDPTD